MFIQIIINKYKKKKNKDNIRKKTLQLLTNDMKIIDTLEKNEQE